MMQLVPLFLLSTALSFSPPTAFAPRLIRSSSLSSSSSDSLAPDLTIETTTRSLIEGSFKKVFLAGSSKGVGKMVLDELVKSGVEVVSLVRSKEAKMALEGIDGVSVVEGDAFDYKSVEDNMFGCDAVITTLSGSDPATGKLVDYVGSNNCIEAAGILGITRVLLVSSVGCGDSKDAIKESVYQQLEPVLKEKTKAENVLIKYYTNTKWTIIRPGGLKSDPATSTAILTDDNMACGSVNRADLAKLIVAALASEKTHKKILTCVDPEQPYAGEDERPAPASFDF